MSSTPAWGPPPEVVVSYLLQREEFVEVQRWALVQGKRALRYGVFGLTFIIMGSALLAKGLPMDQVPGLLLVLGGLYLVVWVADRWLRAGERAWERTAGSRQPQMLGFSPSGVWSRSPTGAASTTWAAYSSSFETETSYGLYGRTGRTFAIIPKRAFSGYPAEAYFRQLLETYTNARLRPAPVAPGWAMGG